MNDTKQREKADETPVVSPLVNEKTYGERVYSRIFNWGLNYWLNLLSSAGFSQWAANSIKEIKVFGCEKAQPRVLQEKLGDWIASRWFMNGFKNRQIAEHGTIKGMEFVSKRGFAMAESLTLLVPGFVVMIPSVWLGAKIKPAFVEWLNKRHYGDEAMDDPSLMARHQAIRAEARPTLIGAFIARLGTVGAVQLSTKLVGSESNTINWIGKKTNIEPLKNFEGINPSAGAIGRGIGGSLPTSFRAKINNLAGRLGLSWSKKQLQEGNSGPYNQATQDLAKYIVMDTIYTIVSASTIHPAIKLLRMIPGMSYKPKTSRDGAHFEGDTVMMPTKIKVPHNQYGEFADRDPTPDAPAPTVNAPGLSINQVASRGTVAQHEHHIAG